MRRPDLPKFTSGPACPDCKAKPGERHHMICDVATCLTTGTQRLLHITPTDVLVRLLTDIPDLPADHDCGHDIWTGERTGIAECRQHDLFVRRDGDLWVPCPADWPGATADLNRLFTTAAWSPAERSWVLA